MPHVWRSATMIAAVAVCSMFTGASRAAATPMAASAQHATLAGTWGTAREVPGTATLNQGGYAQVGTVSCASVGNCSAAGFYSDSSGAWQAFVVNQTNGTWHAAREVPGTAALNQGGRAGAIVSCASAGNCGAGGAYLDSSGADQAYVVNETNGTWHAAREVPGTATLNQFGNAFVFSVSCASAGNCSAGGYYTDSTQKRQAFVVNQTNGTWRAAREVPGTATLNQGGYALVNSMSCASAGNCSAGGLYTDSSGRGQTFIVNQTNGTWGTARQVPGTATLNQGNGAQIDSVSCPSAGNCSAGGYDSKGAFVVSEINGTWDTATQLPGFAETLSVSCASAGNCSAGGDYFDSSSKRQAFVVNQTNGTWRAAREVPGTAALNQGGFALVNSVSCGAAGNCSAGGWYTDSSGHAQAFVVNET